MSEFAPGIPAREVSSELPIVSNRATWEYGLHDHQAERRGHHFDLRLGDPNTGQAHSWAMQTSLPKSGETAFAIQQPTHTIEYLDWEGTIPKGSYGAGKVMLADRAPTEVMNARPGHVSFNLYRGSGPEEYTLHRMGGKVWKIHNRTLDRTKHPNIPESKPAYREVSPDKIDVKDDRFLVSAKIDDAHNLFYFPQDGSRVRVLSYRRGKKRGVIEHTHKVPTLMDDVRAPQALRGSIFRGGLYAKDSRGKLVPVKDLAGILNSNVWKSREKQLQKGLLLPVLYDVVAFKGKNMEDAAYEEKLEAIGKVLQELPNTFEVPEMATSPRAKEKLIRRIASGTHPDTEEGVVLWDRKHAGQKPIKAKFHKEHDVYIRGFYPGKGKYRDRGVGGFSFSHEPEGPVVGRVGTGLSDVQRVDMHDNPEKYMGVVARVKAQDKFQSGALRSPSMQGFHLDKNPQEVLDMVKAASYDSMWFSALYEPVFEFLWGDSIA